MPQQSGDDANGTRSGSRPPASGGHGASKARAGRTNADDVFRFDFSTVALIVLAVVIFLALTFELWIGHP